MAIDWWYKVDGVTVFPELPVYLRNYHAAWQKNQRIKDAVQSSIAGDTELTRPCK